MSGSVRAVIESMVETALLDEQQQHALQADLSLGAVAITGPSGSGKTTALLATLDRLTRATGMQLPALTTAAPGILRERLREAGCTALAATPAQLACALLRDEPTLVGEHIRIIDPVEARRRFSESARGLLDLDWEEFTSGDLDPEVSGLRSPERFLTVVFNLLRKLRASGIEPSTIYDDALRASTQFYAQPPNFADADLLRRVKESYRGSLRVDRAALDLQRRREIDLTRIIARLTEQFANDCRDDGVMTEDDAVYALAAALRNDPAAAERVRRRYPAAVLDDAQDLTLNELRFLQAMFGDRLANVVIAGDPEAAMYGFRGARAETTFAVAATTVALTRRRRGTPTLIAAVTTIASATTARMLPPPDASALLLQRTPDSAAQAERIAEFIADRIAAGVAPRECAVLARTTRCVGGVIDALLARGLPVDLCGDIDPCVDRGTADVFALFGVLADERRAADLLRILASPLLALSDRTLVLLCSPPEDPMLLSVTPSARSRDTSAPDRIAQLARNVFEGANDHMLGPEARARLAAFRGTIASWRRTLRDYHLADATVQILAQSGLIAGEGARARFSRAMTARLLAKLLKPLGAAPDLDLHGLIRRYEHDRDFAVDEALEPQIDREAVCIGAVNAVRGRSFAAVAVADARAGAFPRYYVPEPVLYSPQRGFIARENVTVPGASRTAKATWYIEKTRVREHYNREDRRMFAYALGRARETLLVTAPGAATRARNTPEFLEELCTLFGRS